MNNEGIYLKEIMVRNTGKSDSQFYLVLTVNRVFWVGSVLEVGSEGKSVIQQWEESNIRFESQDQIFVGLWDYEQVKEVKRVMIPTDKITSARYAKVLISSLQLEIFCESKNPSQQQEQHQFQDYTTILAPRKKSFILPNPKPTLSPSRKDFPLPSSNQSKDEHKFQYNLQEESYNETSLQKIITNSKQSSLSKGGAKSSKRLSQKANFNSNGNSINLTGNNTYSFFDDYEARPRDMKNRDSMPIIKEKVQKMKENLSKEVNSTTSSSLIKKSLKNTIKILTENPAKIQNTQRAGLNIQNLNNRSKEFLQYGLNQTRRMKKYHETMGEIAQKSSDLKKLENTSTNVQHLRRFYEKALTKKEMDLVARMNSFQLSKSIYEQYGLDLSLNKSKESRSIDKSGFIKEEKKIKKGKNNGQSKKSLRKDGSISSNQNRNGYSSKFQDYGELSFSKKQIHSSKSLKRTQRPKVGK